MEQHTHCGALCRVEVVNVELPNTRSSPLQEFPHPTGHYALNVNGQRPIRAAVHLPHVGDLDAFPTERFGHDRPKGRFIENDIAPSLTHDRQSEVHPLVRDRERPMLSCQCGAFEHGVCARKKGKYVDQDFGRDSIDRRGHVLHALHCGHSRENGPLQVEGLKLE